jgi:hypothetical protein
MLEQRKMTVTLSWRGEEGVNTRQIGCADQSPHELAAKLVQKLGLSGLDRTGEPTFYRLRLDGEQGPALRPRELLSLQNVADGSRLWLVAERFNPDELDKRCLLQLPDGSEVVVPSRGHCLTRTWLLGFVELHNPEGYHQEVERLQRQQSPYRFVSNSPHCEVRAASNGIWVVTTGRDDVLTEWATDREFDRVPSNIPQQLHNGARLRLGGDEGLTLTVILV